MRRPLVGLLTALGLFVIVSCVGDDPSGPGTTSAPGQEGGVEGGATPAIACSAGSACANGAPCVDGFCCDGACTGTCEACNVAGNEGKCSAVTGAPKHGKCDGDTSGVCAGACDGTQRALCTYPAVACGSAGSCAGGTASLPSTCSAGTCPATKTQLCALGCLEDTCLGVTQVAGGYYHTCAVLTDKKVRCWGRNEAGETAQDVNTYPVVSRPMEVPGLSNVIAVAATFATTCALLGDGSVKCWGSNPSAELGNGVGVDTAAHSTPTVVSGLTGVTFLAGSSSGHFCAIVAGGAIKCWGSNAAGELGNGTASAAVATPTTTCQPGSSSLPCTPSSGATFVAGGDDHTCAVFAGNQVACWGGNGSGQVGQTAGAASHPFPAFVAGLTATYLTAGNRITCAASGGGAKCFGGNGSGRIGNGQDTGNSIVPASVCTKQDCSTLLTGVTAVTTFDESSCALAGGAVKCWGINSGGQLGDGNATASQNYAATSAIASGAVAVASGGGVNFAIVVDGANRDIRCWGGEGFNQCGDGTTTTSRKTPIAPKW
ncbi:MAG: hypothetical protein QOI41_3978 [Myxococcales bacterium]|nr:hypothetical protein [Myxococcales bacterium]